MRIIASFIQTFIFIIILCSVFYDIPSKDLNVQIKNILGFFFLLSFQRLLASSSSAYRTVYIQLDLNKKEIESRYYSYKALLLSRICFDICYNLLHPFIISIITYFLILYPLYSYLQFFIFCSCLSLLNLIGISFGLLFSSSFQISRIISSSIFLIFNLFSRLSLDNNSMFYPIRIIQYDTLIIF